MDNDYKIKLEVRGSTSEFGADSVTELLLLMATELFRLDQLTSPQNAQDIIEKKAKKLVEKYQSLYFKNNNRCRSPIKDAGLEIEIAKCYLKGMKIKDVVDWLQKEKGFKTSMTSIGRYWVKFAEAHSGEKDL